MSDALVLILEATKPYQLESPRNYTKNYEQSKIT